MKPKLNSSETSYFERNNSCTLCSIISQHMLRVMFQTRIWMNSHVAKSVIRSSLDLVWIDNECGLIPLFFEGPMASYILQDLVCTCRIRQISLCKNCVCSRQNLSCTSACLCEGSNNRNKEVTQQTRFHNDTFATVYEQGTGEDF